MVRRHYILWLLPALFLVASCAPRSKVNPALNLAYLYNPSLTSLHPRFLVYHENDQTSILSVKVYPVELLFNQANEAGTYQAKLEIFYRLYDITGVRTLVDTGAYKFPIDMQNVRREFVANIRIKAEKPNRYNLEVITNDALRNKAVQTFIPIDKSSDLNAQNYELFRFNSTSKIFNPILDSNQVVQISYTKQEVDSLWLRYYPVDRNVPYPPSLLIPSVTYSMVPDTLFSVPYPDTTGIRLTREGMYHYTVSPAIGDGLTLYYFGEHFPSVKTTALMIDPLEYLLSDAELARMKREPSPKLAVDNFWISVAGNIEKARELIRIYYNRVFYANYFFVSYKEGWKTDRGMIYIIYGPPDVLYKNDEEERWIYGKDKQTQKIVFTFRKENNPFTENDYRLRRSDDMVSRWGEAINSWKRGVVFDPNQANTESQ